MIVVTIVAILATLGMPAWNRVKERTLNMRFVNDLRVSSNAFQQYALENGFFPDDALPGEMPPDMAGFFRDDLMTQRTPLGGQWDWDFGQFGFTAGLSVYQPSVTEAQMRAVDRIIDDGNLAQGEFQFRTDGYIYVLQP